MRFIHMDGALRLRQRVGRTLRWADYGWRRRRGVAQTDSETIALRRRVRVVIGKEGEGRREGRGYMDRLLKCLSLVW